MSEIVKAEHICQALEAAYTSPEWYLGFEVGNSTGANCRRHADAIAINAYPSKGFETRGFEIKVSKADLATELNNGLKSDEIARFCDYWFLVIPKGLADGFTLPPTWGVIEYQDGKLRQKSKAAKLDKITPTTGFLCAMLRGRERMMSNAAAKISADREEQIRRAALYQAGSAVASLKALREKLNKVKEATGIDLDDWEPTETIIRRLQAAKSLKIITQNMSSIMRAADNLAKDAQEIQEAANALLMSKEAQHG